MLCRERFNASVGVRRWDIGLTMLDCTPLSDTEVTQALWVLKQTLIAYGYDPASKPKTDAYTVRELFGDIWRLGREEFLLFVNIPEWDDITDQVFTYA